MGTAVALESVDAGWGARTVLSSLSLEIDRGEVLCIVGPGGSGKSTILSVLEGLSQTRDDRSRSARTAAPEVGLWWRGRWTSCVGSAARLRQHGEFRREPIGALLDDPRDSAAWLAMGEEQRGALHAVFDTPLGEAPESLRRLVSFLLVVRSDAQLLLLDEPLFALDASWSAAVHAELLALADADRTMVIVTHYLPLARAVADRVMLVVDGCIIEVAATEDFFHRARHPRTRQYIEWGG